MAAFGRGATGLIMSAFRTSTETVTRLLQPVVGARVILPDQVASVCKDSELLVGTHDGSFHCDEALAISLLHLALHDGKPITIVRTRKPDILGQCAMLVDVGAVYDPETHRYDHHQREFQGTMDGYHTRLSSAGLVYKHFGKAIILRLCQQVLNNSDLTLNDTVVDLAYDKIYREFIEHVDAIDNGIAVSKGDLLYHVSTTLSSRVGLLNAPWNVPASPSEINERFVAAMECTGREFLEHVYNLLAVWWPARAIVQSAIQERHTFESNGKILVLFHYCPWVQHLFEIERSDAAVASSPALYTVYEDSSQSWRIQAVPVSEHSFESRKALPASWRGLRDKALSDVVGLDGCMFVHASGFIGGHQTKEGALAMARMALEL